MYKVAEIVQIMAHMQTYRRVMIHIPVAASEDLKLPVSPLTICDDLPEIEAA